MDEDGEIRSETMSKTTYLHSGCFFKFLPLYLFFKWTNVPVFGKWTDVNLQPRRCFADGLQWQSFDHKNRSIHTVDAGGCRILSTHVLHFHVFSMLLSRTFQGDAPWTASIQVWFLWFGSAVSRRRSGTARRAVGHGYGGLVSEEWRADRSAWHPRFERSGSSL